MTYTTKTRKEKNKDIWITIIRHGGLSNEPRVMALSIKCDSLALQTESRDSRESRDSVQFSFAVVFGLLLLGSLYFG